MGYKKIKKLTYCIAFLVLAACFASAIDLIENDIGSYKYQEVALQNGTAKQDMIEARYQLEDTNKVFYVRILQFDSSDGLNGYLNRKSEPKTKEYGQETTYVEDNGYNLFWVSGNNVIFVSSEAGTPNNFPEEIVKKYLEIYPSKCDTNWCKSTSTKLNEKDFIFKNIWEIEPRIRDYTQKNIPCPNKNPVKDEIKSKIRESLYDKDRFNDAEINFMIKECRNGKEAFTVKLKEKTPFLNECVNKIKNKLSESNIVNYKEFDVISECVIREEFTERYATEMRNNANFFENLLEKRANSAVNEIKLKEATHERTEDDDEEEYTQRLEQERMENDPSTFDPDKDYTSENFPMYPSEPTENFLQRINNYMLSKKKFLQGISDYFKRIFNSKE